MTALTKAAVTGAVLTSAIALGDAVWQSTSDGPAPWDPVEGIGWVAQAGDGVHGVTYALLAAALVQAGSRVDAGRRAVRWVRRVLVADLSVLAGAFGTTTVGGTGEQEGLVAGVLGIAFLAMFLLAVVLGATLLRRPAPLRVPVLLLVSPLVVVPLTVLAQVAVGWGHPGYTETVVYLGLALLGQAASSQVERPVVAGVSRAQTAH